MLVRTYGSAVYGIEAIKITIEVDVSVGMGFFLVGLPDSAVKESFQRIETALRNNGYKVPGRKIIVNMAPADIKKEGSAYDLPLSIGILAASEQIEMLHLEKFMIMGELALDGTIRPIKGALPIALSARNQGLRGVILPQANAKEAAVVDDIEVYGVEHITQVIEFLSTGQGLEKVKINLEKEFFGLLDNPNLDFADVKGQENVKRALEIAAAGGHNVLMIGAPGSGKTMLAKRMFSILPPLSLEEALETTKIHSVAGKLGSNTSLITQRPFRSPHHTISDVALVGGGSYPQPGEISLAHNGVLFLDELPEFKRSVLEVLRQPLEDRIITISRSKFTVQYPASFMLIAAMNPCPCGYYNHPTKSCVCSIGEIKRYMNKISGPLLDRFDLHIEVIPVSFDDLAKKSLSEKSKEIRKRVIKARKRQQKRFASSPKIHYNAQMDSKLIRQFCEIDETSSNLLKSAVEKLKLSARAYDRILKVARTIADLEGSYKIEPYHIAEAIQYRTLDKETWGLK